MEVWASYSLSDLLLFSPSAYFRLYELLNAALWPLHLLLLAAGIALVVLTRRASPGSITAICVLLACLWATVAWWFLHQRYAPIHLAASWYAAAFGIQALLLLFAGMALRDRLGLNGWADAPASRPGLALLVYALAVHPFIGVLAGNPWVGVELFGLAPDPTALGTLGILLMATGMTGRLLMLIPLAWCLISALTYVAMELSFGLATPAAACIAMLWTWLLRRRASPGKVSPREDG